MKTTTRLVLMMGALGLVFVVGVLALRVSQQREARTMVERMRSEREDLLDNLITRISGPLATFASDYANWDEMVTYMQTRDPAWAALNIDPSLATFEADAAWIIDQGGQTVYATGPTAAAVTQGIDLPALLRRMTAEKFVHFYAQTPLGLVELRTAPIQPTSDREHTSPPLGWLIVGRAWNEAHLATLGRLLRGEVEIREKPLALAHDANPLEIHIQRPLVGLDGSVLRTLHLTYVSKPLELLLGANVDEVLLFVICGAGFLAVTVICVARWVIRPLRVIERSLATQTTENLGPLAARKDEFGHVASLITAASLQRAALESEVLERRRTQTILSERENQLRQSAELQTRLARDLHDGVIQSIYAVGLGVEHSRHLLASDLPAADKKLRDIQQNLNATIRDVRNFILGLDPTEFEENDFRPALIQLVENFRPLHPTQFHLQLPEDEAVPLSAAERTHALQIIRETYVNALRHSGATEIRTTLTLTATGPRLEVRDNGKGFAPSEVHHGRGMANLRSRVAEIGAELKIFSQPGSGAWITVQFLPRVPPSP